MHASRRCGRVRFPPPPPNLLSAKIRSEPSRERETHPRERSAGRSHAQIEARPRGDADRHDRLAEEGLRGFAENLVRLEDAVLGRRFLSRRPREVARGTRTNRCACLAWFHDHRQHRGCCEDGDCAHASPGSRPGLATVVPRAKARTDGVAHAWCPAALPWRARSATEGHGAQSVRSASQDEIV